MLLYACSVSRLHVVKYLLEKMEEIVKKKTYGQINVLKAYGFNEKNGELDEIKDLNLMADSVILFIPCMIVKESTLIVVFYRTAQMHFIMLVTRTIWKLLNF